MVTVEITGMLRPLPCAKTVALVHSKGDVKPTRTI